MPNLAYRELQPWAIRNHHRNNIKGCEMTSVNSMIEKIEGLAGTDDVSEWEDEFIASIVKRTDHGKNTTSLSEKQLDIVQRIHDKHFA